MSQIEKLQYKKLIMPQVDLSIIYNKSKKLITKKS